MDCNGVFCLPVALAVFSFQLCVDVLVFLNHVAEYNIVTETCEWEEVTYSGSYVPDPRIGHSMYVGGGVRSAFAWV